ncbi:MAG: CPBP family intramembrane glutamic endopeptidase [Nocardioides sp.]
MPAAEAPAGLAYHEIYRAGRRGWWWYLLGIVAMLTTFLLVNVVVVIIGFVLYYVATGTPLDELGDKLTALADTDNVTPSVLLFLNLVLVLAIPVTWLVVRVIHDLKPRWLASVAPRIRWTWLFASFGTAFVSLFVAVVLGALLPTGDAESVTGSLNDFTSTTRDFLLVIVLLTPLQAVSEEYVFRGYLTQAFGGLIPNARVSRYVAVIAPSLLFAAAHGGQSFPVFCDRFAFGVVAGVLVIATGGLEAGIAYHVLNNLLAFGIALFFGDMTSALNPSGGTWWDVVVSFVKSAIFVGLSIWVARRMGLQTRTDPTVLAAPSARV